MNEAQTERVEVALEADASYWILKADTEEKGSVTLVRWEADDLDDKDKAAKQTKAMFGQKEGAPTIGELTRYATHKDVLELTPLKFVISAHGPKGTKRLKYASFDPPEGYVNGRQQPKTDLQTAVTAIATTIEKQSDATVRIINASGQLVEKTSSVVDKVGKTVAGLVEFERERAERREAELEAQHEKDLEQAQMLLGLQMELQSALDEGSLAGQFFKALLEDPSKLENLIATGVDSVSKIKKLRAAVKGDD